MQSLRIARRNVLRRSRRSLLLGGAIAFGFFLFTLLDGFTGGIVESVSENFVSLAGGHVYVTGSEVSERGSEISFIRDTGLLERALGDLDLDVARTTPRSTARASVIFGSREEAVELVGVDVRREEDFLSGVRLAAGSADAFLADARGALLPEELLEELGVQIGESVLVRAATVTGQQNVSEVVVAGALAETLLGAGPGGTDTGYARIGTVNELLAMGPNEYQTLNIHLEDPDEIERATEELQAALTRVAPVEPRGGTENGFSGLATAFGFGGLTQVDEAERWEGTKFEVTNLNDVLEGLTQIVNLVNTLGVIVFLVIGLIIVVGVTNSYRMTMLERRAEIGTMRAMGLQRSGVRDIFLWEATLVSLGGALAGLVAALLVMGAVGLVDFGEGGASAFFLDAGHFRFAPSPLSALGSLVLVCLLGAAAAYLPARAAAHLEPAEALRAT